jgi:transcriptional regulator with XRE-family HTH domain
MELSSGGGELKRLRQIGGLSQSELSMLSGIARSRISSVECGYGELNESEVVRAERVIKRAIADKYQMVRSVVESTSGVGNGK